MGAWEYKVQIQAVGMVEEQDIILQDLSPTAHGEVEEVRTFV